MERDAAVYCVRDVRICSFGQEYFAHPRKPSGRGEKQQGATSTPSRLVVVARYHPVHVGAAAYRVAQRGFVVSIYRALSILHQRLHARTTLDRPRLEEQRGVDAQRKVSGARQRRRNARLSTGGGAESESLARAPWPSAPFICLSSIANRAPTSMFP